MPNENPEKVRFEYIKSSLFRMIHADGAYGGVTPRLGVFLSFFSERPPIPKVLVHHIKPDGTVGEEIKEEREGRKGIIREAEFGVVLDLDVAKSLTAWLQQKIDEIESIKTKIERSKQEPSLPENVH